MFKEKINHGTELKNTKANIHNTYDVFSKPLSV